MPQAKNHLTASTQAKNGSLYAVIQYKDENGKRKNKWKSLGLKEGASKAKINAAMREAVNDFEKELTEILTRSQNPDADMPVFEYLTAPDGVRKVTTVQMKELLAGYKRAGK